MGTLLATCRIEMNEIASCGKTSASDIPNSSSLQSYTSCNHMF